MNQKNEEMKPNFREQPEQKKNQQIEDMIKCYRNRRNKKKLEEMYSMEDENRRNIETTMQGPNNTFMTWANHYFLFLWNNYFL